MDNINKPNDDMKKQHEQWVDDQKYHQPKPSVDLVEQVAKEDYMWRFCGIPDEYETEWEKESICIKQNCREFAKSIISLIQPLIDQAKAPINFAPDRYVKWHEQKVAEAVQAERAKYEPVHLVAHGDSVCDNYGHDCQQIKDIMATIKKNEAQTLYRRVG